MISCYSGSFLLLVFIVLGFAYIVWTTAAKESGGLKLAGQIIAVVIVVLMLLGAGFGMVYGGKMKMKGMKMHHGMLCPMDKMEMPEKAAPAAPMKK